MKAMELKQSLLYTYNVIKKVFLFILLLRNLVGGREREQGMFLCAVFLFLLGTYNHIQKYKILVWKNLIVKRRMEIFVGNYQFQKELKSSTAEKYKSTEKDVMLS